VDDLRGEEILLFERVLLSARLREFDELEEVVCCIMTGGGCVVRAREERRGVMTELYPPWDPSGLSASEVIEILETDANLDFGQ
jgi:hypothetical protein